MKDEGTAAKQRNINIDLIKCIAAISVISVHFFGIQDIIQNQCLGKECYL